MDWPTNDQIDRAGRWLYERDVDRAGLRQAATGWDRLPERFKSDYLNKGASFLVYVYPGLIQSTTP